MNIPENIRYIMQSTPKIDEKTTRSLIKDYKKNKDSKLKEQIINSYLWLVLKVAQKYHKKYFELVDLFDLFEEGITGLVKSIDSYRPVRNSLFYLYAEKLISRAIEKYISEKPLSMIHVSKNVLYKIRKFKKIWEDLVEKTGQQPSLSDIGKKMGISSLEAKQLYQYMRMLDTYESLSNPIAEDITVEDSLEDVGSSLEDVLSLISEKEVLEDTLKKVLNEKELFIIKQRYLNTNRSGKHISYRSLAKMLRTSHEYVRKAEKRILKKLLDYIKDKF